MTLNDTPYQSTISVASNRIHQYFQSSQGSSVHFNWPHSFCPCAWFNTIVRSMSVHRPALSPTAARSYKSHNPSDHLDQKSTMHMVAAWKSHNPSNGPTVSIFVGCRAQLPRRDHMEIEIGSPVFPFWGQMKIL